MTAQEQFKLIGLTGHISHNKMRIDVKILDAKTAYGSVRVQIEPVAGIGSAWVMLASVGGLS